MSKRPEAQAPADVYYDVVEAGKYTSNSRIMEVQAAMAARCIELLSLPAGESRLVLDVGCGSGLSGDALVEAGHEWVGLDISSAMVDVAVERGCGAGGDGGGDMLLGDMGQGFGFRAGVFDGAISVSALQWLCYSDRRDHRSARRLEAFFTSLYRSLRRGARAALQFYPEGTAQLELITNAALRCGFTGGLVVDYPHSTKAKKYYLCLFAGGGGGSGGAAGGSAGVALPAPRTAGSSADAMLEDGDDDNDDDEEDDGGEDGDGGDGGGAAVPFEQRRGEGGAAASGHRLPRRARKVGVKSRAWIVAKKESARRAGKEHVRPDSKYTGRKRGPRF